MGYGDKLKSWLLDENMEEDSQEQYYPVESKTSLFEQAKDEHTSQAVQGIDANSNNDVILFEPRAFGESTQIGQYLCSKKSAVVNLHRLQKEQAKRVIDFLSGVIFAIDGDIQLIGDNIFLCTPVNVRVGGEIKLDQGE